jgi:site-specific DNA-methyltransferase (adenine-specific)
MKDFDHHAMFPKEVPYRLIKMLSWKNSLVVDPFSGAGTTALVCKELERDFKGFEMSEKYYKRSLERIA